MKKSLIIGSVLLATCFYITGVEAKYTEEWVGKYADQDVRIDYLLTQVRVPDRFNTSKETGWTGSKDPSLREAQTKEKVRPVRPNGKTNTIQKIEEVEKVASSEEQLVTSVNPRYIRKKYTLMKKGNDVCFKHDYPIYVNDTYPEMGVDFYAFEHHKKELDVLKENVKKAENKLEMEKMLAHNPNVDRKGYREVENQMNAMMGVQSLLLGLFGGQVSKRNTNDLNIIQDSRLYYLDRVKKDGKWANLGDAIEQRSQDLYMTLEYSKFYDDIGTFNIVKELLLSSKNLFDVNVLEIKKGKIDNITYDIERVEIKKLSVYGTPIEGAKILCSLYYNDGILSWFTFPYYDDKVDRLKDFDNDSIRYEYPSALFKVDNITTVIGINDFDKIDGYKLERIPLGW